MEGDPLIIALFAKSARVLLALEKRFAIRPNIRRNVIAFTLFNFAMSVYAGPASVSARALEMPNEAQSVITATLSVATIGQADGRVIVLSRNPNEQRAAITFAFNAAGKTREEAFGKLADQTRFEILQGGDTPDWRGIEVVNQHLLFFDGSALAFHEIDPKVLRSVMARAMPWDLIKPPRDTRGDATTPEITAFRAQFKRAFGATSGTKVAGVATIPSAWMKSSKRLVLMALRLKGVPLAVAECEPDEPSACVLVRQCHLEGAKDLAPEAVTGLVVAPKDRIIYIGDRRQHRLLGFKFGSCYNVTRARDLELPPKIKELTNMSTDADGRLWVTTKAPDDFTNASVFYWPAGAW